MQEVKYKVQYLNIGVLKAHPDNPRFIIDEDFNKLCASIKNIPYYFEARPIICDAKFTIWAGNQRYRASQYIGLTAVPVVVLDFPEDTMMEIMIRDNVQNGKWDTGLLSALFSNKELEKWGVDLSQFGVADEDEEEEDKKVEAEKMPTIKLVFDTVEQMEEAKADAEAVAIKFGGKLSTSKGQKT